LFIPVPNSYRIRQLTDKEEATQVSKDVKKVRSFEQSLLANYQAYLTDLERFSKCMYKLASSSLHLQINHGSLLTRQFSETC
jgi:nucleolar complex protein 3